MPSEQIELFAKSLFPAISGKTLELRLDQAIKSYCFVKTKKNRKINELRQLLIGEADRFGRPALECMTRLFADEEYYKYLDKMVNPKIEISNVLVIKDTSEELEGETSSTKQTQKRAQ